MTMSVSDEGFLEEVSRRVSAYDIRNVGSDQEIMYNPVKHRKAAVLLPITIKDGELSILLTKRSKNLRTHPSTVAFPGGMRDENDESDVDAALREAEEEIGLPPSAVKVLGILTLGVTLPYNIVYPVVGVIPQDFVPNCNPSEVEYAFYVPLKIFSEKGNIAKEEITAHGTLYAFSVLNYNNNGVMERIFGFTCNFCIFLSAIVFGSDGKGDDWTLANEMKAHLELSFYFTLLESKAKL